MVRRLVDSKFELIWRSIFVALFIGIMLPLRCFVNSTYDPGWFGVPNFVWNWVVYGVTTYVLIVVYCRSSLKRPENHVYDGEGKND